MGRGAIREKNGVPLFGEDLPGKNKKGRTKSGITIDTLAQIRELANGGPGENKRGTASNGIKWGDTCS